jgi:hypothetical protein
MEKKKFIRLDGHQNYSPYLSDCSTCKHLRYDFTCTAYHGLDGIPDRILSGEVKHREVQPDQEGETVYSRQPTFRTATAKDFKVGALLYTARTTPIKILYQCDEFGRWWAERFDEEFMVFESEKDL